MTLTLDHIVVGAATLEDGHVWVRERLGGEPLVGGRHAFMGTHNLVLRLDDAAGRELYLELLAIDPSAALPGRPRWFDLDRPEVQAALSGGPRLLAWVARSDDLDADRVRLQALRADPGPVFTAQRDTLDGVLRWRITVPAGGARVAGGAVPTLIAWESPSPARSLQASGVSLERLVVRRVEGDLARSLGSAGAQVEEGPGPALEVWLAGPAGRVGSEVVGAP
jgi:hypothetical protein